MNLSRSSDGTTGFIGSDSAMTGFGNSGNGNDVAGSEPKQSVTGSREVFKGDPGALDGIAEQRAAISELERKVSAIESVLPGTDEIIEKSMESVVATLKNVSHNHQVLETKFEDLLRNQANSDAAINELSAELNRVGRLLQERLSATSSSTSVGIANSSGHNASYQNSGGISAHRGPGRPPKRAVSVLGSGERKGKLPFHSDHISKNKRFFIEPGEEVEPAGAAIGKTQRASSAAKDEVPQEPKKRRGRPSKKSIWENSAGLSQKRGNGTAGTDGTITKEGTPVEGSESVSKSTRGRRKSQRSKNGSMQYDEQSDLSSSFSGASDDETQEEEGDESKRSSSANRGSSRKNQTELERRRDERERMLVTMKYSDRNVTRNFMELNKDLFMAMKQEERKKRMTALPFEAAVVLGKYQMANKPIEQLAVAKTPFSLSQASEFSAYAQSPMSNPPDSARSVTPNAGSTDGHSSFRAVSDATEEGHGPEVKERESGLRYDESTSNGSLKRFGDQSSMLSDADGPRKVRILSILNDDASDVKVEDVDSSRRKLELLNSASQGGDLDNISSSQISMDSVDLEADMNGLSPHIEPKKKKRVLTVNDRRQMSKMIPMLPEKKDKRGRPSSNSQSSDAASLLMSSPVELYCRHGFFYKKGSTVPITACEYLDLKFRHKEDELIKLTMHEEDYAELTRQDRINAYFLKPDIEIETAMACQVLSNVILTERYVNSLEYFLMEFRWENRLVSLGLKLRESKRTWQRRKALFALFEFWRDKSRDKRGFPNYTLLHAIKEMENYRVFINRSVSWFYNHITLLKMILFDLCDNTSTHWREWMFARGVELPIVGVNGVDVNNINRKIDNMLILDFLEDGSRNSNKKSSLIPYKEVSEAPSDLSVENSHEVDHTASRPETRDEISVQEVQPLSNAEPEPHSEPPSEQGLEPTSQAPSESQTPAESSVDNAVKTNAEQPTTEQ